ncbi:MAG: LysM peptidoglycan-binding domain-containing protein [bacterium]|nr:LysM peptidoglycan-binding domain-containing protein [bacterium]
MGRSLPLLIVIAWALAVGPAAADPTFPKPAKIVPQVEFWKRIYSEVDTDHGLMHDSRQLGIVYETAAVPDNLSRRGRDRKIKARRSAIKSNLRTLASGKRSGLTAEQKRILALFPSGVSNASLRKASGQIRFQRGQANKFRDGLVRQGRWEAYMRQVFQDRGLPLDLTALPHVESSFNPKARSHVGASGLWQFTRSTGRLLMRVDHVVDERNDPYLATVAAARLLRENHKRLGTWPLAITAYNHGAGGMERAVRKLGTRDIDQIIDRYKSRTFGFASRNFYCEFLAAREVQHEAARHFGKLTRDPPERPESVTLTHYVKAADLATTFGLSTEALRRANPALQSPVWTGQKYVPKGYSLRIPRDPMRGSAKVVLASLGSHQRHTKQVPDRTYRVRRGDSLSRIADRFGVRESQLVALNGLRSRHRIRIGQVLKLPVRPGSVVATAPPAAIPADGLYTVRRGDTVSSIARRYGVTERDLLATNHLRNRNRIGVGQVLELPGGALSASPKLAQAGIYTVRRGDTLDGIARRFGVTRAALASQNGIRNANQLRAGQSLSIPAK